ncbi:protein mono-ADP-ribosyltransferase PARP12-like, partial [Micropterus dolomieu]|uniref:protein mono-ADP-ribosyltransferase PARP12-like n=1 Tax=Micropterus dolomieu TaxID=147949 RepID=UPI001E8CC307
MFGLKCIRQHAIEQHSRRMLLKKGLSEDIIQELPFIYRNIHQLTAATASTGNSNTPGHTCCTGDPCTPLTLHVFVFLSEKDSFCKPADQSDNSNDICLHFIRNSCKFHNECRRVHFCLPYKWEVFDGVTWTDLQNMEDIEKDFCDPSKTKSCGDRPVDFLTMSQASHPVRRLSTVSSVTKPPHYILTTQWLWYYKGDHGNWVEYGQP